MSGGRWGYSNDHSCNELFDYHVYPDYGLGDKDYTKSVNIARKINPMEDKQLTELVYDVFCLLHSLDWYKSSDTCEETYRKDVRYFKDKWLGEQRPDAVKKEIDEAIEAARNDLYVTFGLKLTQEE